jgi:hypothetical protein
MAGVVERPRSPSGAHSIPCSLKEQLLRHLNVPNPSSSPDSSVWDSFSQVRKVGPDVGKTTGLACQGSALSSVKGRQEEDCREY